ncbi:MAG TPA: radical SAM protein [Anaerolinea sp.]|nr:radical SAM protein [Anaerolinea sp.]
MEPSYLSLARSGDLSRRVEQAYAMLENCSLCPQGCKAQRRAGKLGVCRTGERARVADFFPHHGEEPTLSGRNGSGTVFFAGCNLRCVFCQNWDISQANQGRELEPVGLAEIFLRLQGMGCHNINLVSPSHVVPQVLAAAEIAARTGLRLPLVFNTGGYDSLEALALLDGIIDLYLPDMKYANTRTAHLYSGARHYPQVNQAAVKEMYRQVGDLTLDENGLAARGLLVRHLILPNRLAGTREIVRFLAEQVSPHTSLNLMGQYHPAHKAAAIPALNRPIRAEEAAQALQLALAAGLSRLQ